MSGIILHHYDYSPFTQKALRMLGIKGLSWRSVVTPMILPKPDLVLLTGGYRGTPVMQIGADVYVDSQLIAVELEDRFPEPSLFPNGNRGMPLALNAWSMAFFEAGLHMAIHELSGQWDDAFRKDREALFSKLDFAGIRAHFADACVRLRAHAALIENQLADGRAFLQGDRPGLADIQAFFVPWFTRASMPITHELLAPFPHLLGWEARIDAIGQGTRTEIAAAEAHAEAQAAEPLPSCGVDGDDPLRLAAGTAVEVRPDDYERGAVRGTLYGLRPDRVTVLREDATLGRVAVHFPRLGYSLRAV